MFDSVDEDYLGYRHALWEAIGVPTLISGCFRLKKGVFGLFWPVLEGFHSARQEITGISLPLFAGRKEVSAFRQLVVANELPKSTAPKTKDRTGRC